MQRLKKFFSFGHRNSKKNVVVKDVDLLKATCIHFCFVLSILHCHSNKTRTLHGKFHAFDVHPNSIHFLDISLRSKLFPILHLERPTSRSRIG
jgi:hypothetical protein